jgi:hypothetical protein
MSGEVGKKFDAGKAPISMISRESLEEIALAFAYGANKYGRDNYKGGLAFTRFADAALRHLIAYVSGEDKDPESGLSHLAHAGASICMLIWMTKNRPEQDDRYKKESAK